MELETKTRIMSYAWIYPLAWFFTLAFILHWLLIAVEEMGPLAPLSWLATWAPNIAAVLVVLFVTKEKGGVRRLIGGWAKWRVGAAWYLVAVSPFFVNLLAVVIFLVLGNKSPGPLFPFDWKTVVFMLVLGLLTGASGEELGWRGFALPILQERYSALASSVVVGVMWSAWHLPAYFLTNSYDGIPFWGFTLYNITGSILITWAFNNSGGSVLLATLFHMFENFSLNIFLVAGLITFEYVLILLPILYMVYTVIVVVVYGPDELRK
jgi:membrane protease YdiL (CAAX protease family)